MKEKKNIFLFFLLFDRKKKKISKKIKTPPLREGEAEYYFNFSFVFDRKRRR